MRVDSFWGRALGVLAAVQMAAVTAPSVAWAQGPQPIPYPTAPAPVPYGDPAPPPASSSSAPAPRPPTVAPGVAQAVGQDVIYMKNGGILRGTIIDAIPDAQARIQLATGEIATVPWPAIERIEHGGSGPRPGALPPLPPAPTPVPPPRVLASSAMVWVHVEGADGALLQVDRADDGTWVTACRAPADVQVPVSPEYRIGGGGIRQSGVFHLRGLEWDHVTVTVSGGSKAWLVVGIVITPVAGLVTLLGALVGLVGSVAASADTASCPPSGSVCVQSNGNASSAATAAGTVDHRAGRRRGHGGRNRCSSPATRRPG